MKKNGLKIIRFDEIKISSIGTNFRHVLFKDLNNNKTVDFVVFEKVYPYMWEDILNSEYKKTVYPGEIIEIRLTKELIDKVNIKKMPVSFSEGQPMDIILWEWSAWMSNSKSIRIEWSLKEQLWKIKNHPNKIKTSLDEQEYDYDSPRTNWERDYFDTMTDGTMGDYDDFKGNLDDLYDWLGR